MKVSAEKHLRLKIFMECGSSPGEAEKEKCL